jgi:hypothetical protein
LANPKLTDPREQLILDLGVDHALAHQLLFAHRHPDVTPDFHYEIIRDLHSDHPRVLEMAFRGAAKSTLAEEFIVIEACYRRFRNFIICGESATRACERLAAIKHEFDFNEHIRFLFGDLHGPVWNEDKIVLGNGVVIQAFGRGQSLRGTKHDDVRPDGCLIDDVEDEESVNTMEGRDKAQRWVMRTLLPALAPGARVRMLASMLDPDCLAVRLQKLAMATGEKTWIARSYPWEFIGPQGSKEEGERVPAWPGRFPLSHIDRTRAEYVSGGMLNEYQQEYMVEAVDPSTRVFSSSLFKIEPRVRTWEPVYAVYDPARTVKASSAHTGKVVISWVGNRLIVWEADGQLWLPDRIIEDVFAVSDDYHPVAIGVERDGLEEFLMQPLRAEMTRRRQIIPVVPLKAPVGKLTFIRSLQPFFAAGEIIFTKSFPVLEQQLLSFPTGRNDVPNALAYALRMRPGLPVYDNFGFKNVQESIATIQGNSCYIVLNATRQVTAGALVQLVNNSLRVLSDNVQEGDPGTVLTDILTNLSLRSEPFQGSGLNRSAHFENRPQVFAPPQHWQPYDAIGLLPAAGRAQVRLSTGGSVTAGREELRRRIDAEAHGGPALLVSTVARWTLNALAGGCVVNSGPSRQIAMNSDTGPYAVLMEGLESFAAVVAGMRAGDSEDKPNYAIDARGRRYLSARAQHHGDGGTNRPAGQPVII